MSRILDDKLQTPEGGLKPHHLGIYDKKDLEHYHQANRAIEENRHRIEDTQKEIEELEHTEAVELFQKQISLLQKRLMSDPKFFQQMFITEGTNAIAWEFQQEELSEPFTRILWELLCRADDMSTLLLRFLWNVPLKFKRRFVRAIDRYLSDRYPMFKGPSENWPADKFPLELKRYVP